MRFHIVGWPLIHYDQSNKKKPIAVNYRPEKYVVFLNQVQDTPYGCIVV